MGAGNCKVVYSCGNYLFDSHVCRDKVSNELSPEGVLDSPGCLRMQPGRRKMTARATRRSRHYRLHVTKGGVVRAEYMPVLLDESYVPHPDIKGSSNEWQQVCGPDDAHCLSCE